VEVGYRKPNKTDKGLPGGEVNRAQTESVLSKMLLNAVCQRTAFCFSKQPGQELHHPGVCVEPSKRRSVGSPPVSEGQSLGSSNDHTGF
jgi:hypothetical protein